MPTMSQLVRKGRNDKVRKSKSPVLGIGLKAVKGLSWFNKEKKFGGKVVGDVFGK